MERYVAYYRVSTDKQGESGLGLKAQMQTVQDFLKGKDAEQIAFFREVESGTNGNRPALRKAIQLCKEEGATLLVAKLDRLSRNVRFLFTLKEELDEAGIGFTIVDLPEANNTMVLGVMASVAQHEAELISKRTTEALKEAKKRNGEWREGREFTDEERAKAAATKRRKAREHPAWRRAFWFIKAKREQEQMTYAEIAEALNAEGYRTRRGKKFYPATVREVYLRFTDKI